MSRTSCYCGVRAFANCTKCGAGICRKHRDEVEYRRPKGVEARRDGFGLGATFADAAYHKGYWAQPKEIFVCMDCRMKEAAASRKHWLQRFQSWRNDVFIRALSAVSEGIVYTEMGITYSDVIDGWPTLQVPPERVSVQRVVRPYKPGHRTPFGNGWTKSRPEKTTTDFYTGWSFPNTVSLQVEIPAGHDAYLGWAWVGATVLSVDRRLWLNNQQQAKPYRGDVPHIVVEMARKYLEHHKGPWLGPPPGWK